MSHTRVATASKAHFALAATPAFEDWLESESLRVKSVHSATNSCSSECSRWAALLLPENNVSLRKMRRFPNMDTFWTQIFKLERQKDRSPYKWQSIGHTSEKEKMCDQMSHPARCCRSGHADALFPAPLARGRYRLRPCRAMRR